MPKDWQLYQEEMEDDKSGDKRLLGDVFLNVPIICPFHRLAWLLSAGTFWRPAAGQDEEIEIQLRQWKEKVLSLFPLAHEKERCASARALSIFAIVKARREQVGQTTDLYEG